MDRTCCIFLSLFVVAAALNHRYAEDTQRFEEHYTRVYNYECGVPQPRVFSIKDLLSEKERSFISTDYTPRRTVLHRCDMNSGCCKRDSYVCSPKATEDVDLVFFAKEPGRPAGRYIHVNAQNHTLCTCKSTVSSIK